MKFVRVPLAAGLVIGLLLSPNGGALAAPKPTIKQAKAKLAKLNDQADKVVDRYNAANEKYKKAKESYGKLNDRYKSKLAAVAGLREQVVAIAVNAYTSGTDPDSLPAIIQQGDPAGMLSGLALADRLTAERAATLTAFDEQNRGLKTDRDSAQEAFQEAAQHRDAVDKERDQILKLIGQQKKLLRRLGAYNAGDPNSKGQVYTGPASGSAAAALKFAYAQIGKPYVFGGTGPGGWDCSGLMQAAWRAAGVSLPRTTWEQWAWGQSRKVSMDALEPGDLIFNSGLGHVVMYAGNGEIVHAPQTGDVVKVVKLSDYSSGFAGAIRP
ncbi:C40 family peptidase [Nonomuraea sediminis]|uniref:C40 family peptidase n=1 Tax=Nonomuraea sediminis TaxID=2835864 RepID=UPI0027DEB8F2|nr:NlpC/P60 family protein [Nonomuraea sediminis]